MKKKDRRTKTKKRYITLLENSGIYFLSHVFILRESGQYRLVVIRNKKKLMDKTIRPLKVKEARAFFSQSFEIENISTVEPEWGRFFQPEPQWLDKLLNLPMEEKQKKEKKDAGNRKRPGRNKADYNK